jgi:hypothetical protein
MNDNDCDCPYEPPYIEERVPRKQTKANRHPRAFWEDPEFRNREKECTGPGCQGTGFLRNVPGPNEVPCPVCRPKAAAHV